MQSLRLLMLLLPLFVTPDAASQGRVELDLQSSTGLALLLPDKAPARPLVRAGAKRCFF